LEQGKRKFNSPNYQRMMQSSMLVKNVVYRVLNVIVVFFITVLLSRLAGVAGYGVLSLLIANASIFNLLSGFGADAGITFYAASGRISTGKLVYFIVTILFLQVIALGAAESVSYFITGHLFLLKTGNLHYSWIGLVFFVSLSVTEKYSALLNGHRLFTVCNSILLFSNLIMLILFGIFYITGEERPALFYIGAYVLLNLVQAIFLVLAFHLSVGKNIRSIKPQKADRIDFFSYSIFTFVINTIQFIAYRVDYWLLDHYRGSQELGWYSLAVRLSQLFWVIPLLVASILFPNVAAADREYNERSMRTLVRAMNWVNIAAGAVLFFSSSWLFPWLFGKEYENSIGLFRILLPGVILFCMATVLAAYFAGQKRLKVNFVGSAICLAVILSLDLWLIPSMGMRGAAIASSIGYGVTALYFVIFYCYTSNTPVGRMIIPETGERDRLVNLFRKPAEKNK
jgi:O-antigen/teichoic acid export membrane protein